MPLRQALLVVGLVLALAPAAAFAEDGNQAAIDAARADKLMLQNMAPLEHQVLLGQREINNARAIARLLAHDSHAQTEIPNSMEQYRALCSMAIDHLQAGVTNANAMVAARPWDAHAQAELANANAAMHALWDMIGDSYPGNPYYTQVGGPDAPVYADDSTVVVAQDDESFVAGSNDADAETDAEIDASE